jgi:uncharacterized phage protein (TIGR01671 family)
MKNDKAMVDWLTVRQTVFNRGDFHLCYDVMGTNPDIIKMQFTGLTDKNGKEIYEGDVCRFAWNPILNEPSEIFETELPVTYYKGWGCFVFHWQSNKMKKAQRELFMDYGRQEVYVAIGSPIMYGEGVEVIGNIYRNPELLNP